MRDLQRDIQEVRELRGDLSNYLIHLTRDVAFENGPKKGAFLKAKTCLQEILTENVIYGCSPVGHFRYKPWYPNVVDNDLRAVCFTETPIDQIHLFIGIQNKALKFSSYGLA